MIGIEVTQAMDAARKDQRDYLDHLTAYLSAQIPAINATVCIYDESATDWQCMADDPGDHHKEAFRRELEAHLRSADFTSGYVEIALPGGEAVLVHISKEKKQGFVVFTGDRAGHVGDEPEVFANDSLLAIVGKKIAKKTPPSTAYTVLVAYVNEWPVPELPALTRLAQETLPGSLAGSTYFQEVWLLRDDGSVQVFPVATSL